MLGAALLLALLAAEPSDSKPIIALFPLQDRTGRTTPDQVGQLTDYFGVKITETGRFLVVPRADIEAALKQQRVESYKSCFDESCQIEIGKELAAQKVLHTQIVQVGDLCAVTATLYDLRLSATERAASQKGGCDDNALVASLEAVASELAGARSETAPPPPPPPPERAQTFQLNLDSSPRHADVLIDGRSQGQTPVVVRLPKGTPAELTLERDGYETHRETLTLERDERRRIDLHLEADRKTSRNEWFGLGLGLGGTVTGGYAIGAWLRFVNLHFGGFTLVALETNVSALITLHSVEISACGPGDYPVGYCRKREAELAAYLGPRLGYKLVFGEDHNLELSVGAGLLAVTGKTDDSLIGPAVAPTVRYLFLGDGKFSWGIGIRAIIPLTGFGACADTVQSGELDESPFAAYARCKNSKPIFVELEVPLGWYF